MKKQLSESEALRRMADDANRTASTCELNNFRIEDENKYLNSKIADLKSKTKKLTSMNNTSTLTALVGWALLATKCVKDWFLGARRKQ